MSANIPETMPIKDLLKSTGYTCPDALADKTFDEAASGGDVKVESNKAATIDVSQYTEPVAITPTSGKDAMAKATITLSNIPSGGDTTGFSVQCISLANDYVTCVEFPRSTKVTAVTCDSGLVIAGGVQKGYAVFDYAVDGGTKVSVVYDGDTYSYTYADRDYQSHELVKENP